jgi:hypothetical protein
MVSPASLTTSTSSARPALNNAVRRTLTICRRLAATPGRAANYGWHLACGGRPGVTPGVRVVQPVGLAHGLDHVDYSQFCRLVRQRCELDGAVADFADVLGDTDLASLVSHEGPLPRP